MQIGPVLRVVIMIFVLDPIFGIVDDIIPDGARCIGATGGSHLRVSCLSSSTIVLSNGNGVNIGILVKPFCNADFKPRVMAPMDDY